MKQPESLMRSKNLALILDENFSPVARMRLFSRGVQLNNRLQRYEAARCDKGCFACGNCIDACPVVREKRRFEFQQNMRTSMSLENIVRDECRRCYRCVRACPQVSSEVKEFATGFRRAEKFIHATLATLMFLLMATGIFLYHYKVVIPGWHAAAFGFLHLFAGVLILVVPLIYWRIDKMRLKRLAQNSWKFTQDDATWFKQFKAWLRHPFRDTLPAWTEFNPYHKAWFCYLCVVLPVMALTGLGNSLVLHFLDESAQNTIIYSLNTGIHSCVALCTDLLIFLHLYFKLLRFLSRNIADMYRYWRKNKNFNYPFMYVKKEPQAPQAHSGHH